ncbi:phage tail sheath subtilisin-like domain-containing protein [Sphingomonas sp. UYP23]
MVPFKNIPSNLRVPLFYAEIDNSKANTAAVAQRALLIGQKLASGTYAANVPVSCGSAPEGRAAAGQGSILAGMIDAYRDGDPNGEMWVLPVVDDGAATTAIGSITFTGPTTALGTLPLYVAGRLVAPIIASGQTAAQVATTAVAAINAMAGLPVIAAVDVTVPAKVNLTVRNAGECGNDIDVRFAYRGAAAGENLPAGLGATIVAITGGAGNPVLTTALSNLLDMSFDFIVCSLTDTVSLAAIASLLNDTTGRWAWSAQVYGHCFIAKRGTAGAVAAFATALNNQHVTCVPFAESPTPPWKWAAAFAGVAAVSLRADPGVPLQTLAVPGILPPALASRWNLPTRNNTLLYGGCSTWTVDAAGNVVIENIITTYVTNTQGQADNSYLQIETLFLIVFVLRALSSMVSTKYARVKLAADGTRVMPNSNVVMPSTIRGDIIALYRDLEGQGMVQQAAAFAAGLVVEKDAINPNRVNVLLPAVLIDQLRTFAVLLQFRLQ